jgi:aminoglycoside phosphotransferase (APT) family kinase protein
MDQGVLITTTVLGAVLLALVCVTASMLVAGRRERRRLQQELAASREQLSSLETRLEALTLRVDSPMVRLPAEDRDEPEFVITTAGVPELAPSHVPAPVSARQFTSVAVGESLVTLASAAHGVRRALSAENRNRIRFEMRRELRRARKQRRREVKEARRHLRTAGTRDAA